MRRVLLTVLPLLLVPSVAPAAETAYLYDSSPDSLRIVALDGVGTQFGDPLPVTGLGSGDVVAAIAVRPSDGHAYALTVNVATNPDHAELYRLDIAADSVKPVSVGVVEGFVPTGSFGIAFDPATDELRAVSSSGRNVRIDADTAALLATGNAPAFAADDANAGNTPAISGIAYAGGTLLALAGGEKHLARIGGTTEEPSADFGAVSTIGPTGVAAGFGQDSLETSGTTVWWLRSGYFRADVWRIDPTSGRALSGIPFDVAASGIAVLPSARVSLTSDQAGRYKEGDGAATLQIRRSGSTTGETTVPYTVTDGSAGVAAAAGTIRFAEGETAKLLIVPIPQDDAAEGTQFFTVRLGEPAGNRRAGAVGGNEEMTLIVDDDDDGAATRPADTPAPADRARPTLRVTGVPRRTLSRRALLRGFTVRVLPSERVAIDVSLRANPRRGAFSSAYELALFSKRHAPYPFTRAVKVRPSRRLVGRISRRAKLRLVIEAMDADGNRRTVRRTINVLG